MRVYRFLIMILLFIFIIGCGNSEQLTNGKNDESNDKSPNEEVEGDINEVEENQDESENEQAEDEPLTVEEVAQKVVTSMKNKDMETLADFVHPQKGVRFSPYAYVHVDEDQVFSAEEIKGIMDDQTVYHWGVFDGKGNPIEKTFADYFERFVYDQDYLNAEEISVNERLGHGNTIDNSREVYADATIYEYYFSGFDPQYEGMDWRSLRLALEKAEDGKWYLVGVIHDEWTI